MEGLDPGDGGTHRSATRGPRFRKRETSWEVWFWRIRPRTAITRSGVVKQFTILHLSADPERCRLGPDLIGNPMEVIMAVFRACAFFFCCASRSNPTVWWVQPKLQNLTNKCHFNSHSSNQDTSKLRYNQAVRVGLINIKYVQTDQIITLRYAQYVWLLLLHMV